MKPACSSPEQSVPSTQTHIRWERTARRTTGDQESERPTRPSSPASFRWHAESGYADHCAVLDRTGKTHRTMRTFVARSWIGCLKRARIYRARQKVYYDRQNLRSYVTIFYSCSK